MAQRLAIGLAVLVAAALHLAAPAIAARFGAGWLPQHLLLAIGMLLLIGAEQPGAAVAGHPARSSAAADILALGQGEAEIDGLAIVGGHGAHAPALVADAVPGVHPAGIIGIVPFAQAVPVFLVGQAQAVGQDLFPQAVGYLGPSGHIAPDNPCQIEPVVQRAVIFHDKIRFL